MAKTFWEQKPEEIKIPQTTDDREKRIDFVLGFLENLNRLAKEKGSAASIYEYVPVGEAEPTYMAPTVQPQSHELINRELFALGLGIKADDKGNLQLVERWDPKTYEVFPEQQGESFTDPDSDHVYAVDSDLRDNDPRVVQVRDMPRYEEVVDAQGVDQDGYLTMSRVAELLGVERAPEQSLVGLDGYLLTRNEARQASTTVGLYDDPRFEGKGTDQLPRRPATFAGFPASREAPPTDMATHPTARGRSRAPLTSETFVDPRISVAAPSVQPQGDSAQAQRVDAAAMEYFDLTRGFDGAKFDISKYPEDQREAIRDNINAVNRGMNAAKGKHNPQGISAAYIAISDASANPPLTSAAVQKILKDNGVEEDLGLRTLASFLETARTSGTQEDVRKVLANFAFMRSKVTEDAYKDVEVYNQRVSSITSGICFDGIKRRLPEEKIADKGFSEFLEGLRLPEELRLPEGIQGKMEESLLRDLTSFYGQKGSDTDTYPLN